MDKLLMQEISGVDNPANQLPGWMVAKSHGASGRSVGPDVEWDVAAAEGRIREATKATAGPNPAYASCFLWSDEKVEKTALGVPGSFGDYKFLVCDVVDGQVKVMPAALRAAESRAEKSTIPQSEREAVVKTAKALRKATDLPEAYDSEEARSVAGKLRKLLFPTGKDEVEMTADELNAQLDARFDAFADALVAKLAPAAPASSDGDAEGTNKAEGEGETAEVAAVAEVATEGEAEEALTPEAISKAIGDALAPYNEILEKVLDRVAGIEDRFAVSSRKSLDGQEVNETEEASTPNLGDAIAKAFSRTSG